LEQANTFNCLGCIVSYEGKKDTIQSIKVYTNNWSGRSGIQTLISKKKKKNTLDNDDQLFTGLLLMLGVLGVLHSPSSIPIIVRCKLMSDLILEMA
jgi:hypothetical protein